MDEISNLTEGAYQVPLLITDECFVYRQIPSSHLDDEYKRFPKASHFTIRYDRNEQELSVNWNKFVNADEVYVIIGLSLDHKGEFKDYKSFKMFTLPLTFLRNLKGIEKVVHSPAFNGNPSPIGKPNNYAHASIYFPKPEQVELRLKLATYCQENYDNSFQSVDFDTLENKINTLRKKGQNNKYHCCKPDEGPVI